MKKILFCIIFLGVGIALSIHGKKVLDNAKASLDWPTCDGMVVTSSVDKQRKTSGTGSSRKTSTTYHANVMYDYVVNEATYSSDNVSFGQGGNSNPNSARQIVNRYPAGKKTSVYFNPDSPEIAVLEPGAKGGSYMLLGGGVLFSVVGIAILFGRVR